MDRRIRLLPHIREIDDPSYATLIAHGWDTYIETFDLVLPGQQLAWLDQAKDQAANLDEEGGHPLTVEMEGVPVQIAPRGGNHGIRWIVRTDDFIVTIRNPRIHPSVSVKYLSAGLWEHGVEKLRERVQALFPDARARTAHWHKISRADYAFDFYAPKFTPEMQPGFSRNIVAVSGVKMQEHGSVQVLPAFELRSPRYDYGNRDRLETFTIGSKNSLQLQIYDKGREIRENSGKLWMLAVWEQQGYHPPEDLKLHDIWRIECRFARDFFKERGVNTSAELDEKLELLITEALYTRRLTVPTPGDSNAARWPLHPLFTMAIKQAGARAMAPIGRKFTLRRDELLHNLKKQIAGTAITAAVLMNKDRFDIADIEDVLDDAQDHAKGDPEQARKVRRAQETYRNIDEAE